MRWFRRQSFAHGLKSRETTRTLRIGLVVVVVPIVVAVLLAELKIPWPKEHKGIEKAWKWCHDGLDNHEWEKCGNVF